MNRIAIIAVFLMVWSCSDEPVETLFFDLDTKNGVFIACEGNFMYGNSSLSFYNSDNKKVINQLFYARNNTPLGDVTQSLAIQDNTLFIVVNNSGKIYAVDAETAAFKGVITGLTSPRYIHFVSAEKAYVSDLYAHHLTIINPQTFEITGEIDLENHTSEQMVQLGKKVYVSSWSYDEYLLFIDTETDKMTGKMKVPYQPKDLQVDANSKIWVLSQGSTDEFSEEEIPPALSRIDPVTMTIEQTYRFAQGDLPAGLEINGNRDTLFYINHGVCKLPVEARYIQNSAFIGGENLFYSLGVNPVGNEIYVSDAIDYTQNAVVYRYTSGGALIDSFRVGINPSDYLFR